MDGLSIATACFGFIEIADKAFKTISDFVKDCKDARNDLESVNQELLTLKRTLSLLKDLVAEGGENDLTSNTKRDIREIIRNSLGVTKKLEDELRGQEGRLLAINWATKGKKKVATYKVILETNRRAISLAVETITLATAKNIKRDTTEILDDTTHMKGDLSEIMSRIQILEALVTRQEADGSHSFMLRRYLHELSSMVGSVCDPSSRPASPEALQCSTPHRTSSSSSASDDPSDSEESDSEHMDGTMEGFSELISEVETPDTVSPGLETSHCSPAHIPSVTDEKTKELVAPPESHNTASTPRAIPEPMNLNFTIELMETMPYYDSSQIQKLTYQLRRSQFLPGRLQILRDTYPKTLSSDGKRVLWKEHGWNPDSIYNIKSNYATAAMNLSHVDSIRHAIYNAEMQILSTDASLILFQASKSCWKVYDRLTEKTIKHDFSDSWKVWNLQILPLSKDCSLVLMTHAAGVTVNRIRRNLSTASKKGLDWKCQVLPSSSDATFRHVTISRDAQNIIGATADKKRYSIYIWRLSSDWFTDEDVASFQDIKNPVILNLQHYYKDQERIIGLTSTKTTFCVLKGINSTRTKHQAGFRNIGFRLVTCNIETGASILSRRLSASDIHGDDSKESFFTDAKISSDGRLLRTRIANIPSDGERGTGWTGMETLVLTTEGLEVVYRFKEAWNSSFTTLLTSSLFSPSFDAIARFSRDNVKNMGPRVWLEVYELKKTLGN